ncbi:MAG: S8 family peptidase, partial [Actinomycetota bacterium]
EYAEPNYQLKAFATPNDTYFPQQWALTKIQAPVAWDKTTGSSSVTIAILDTGVDLSHPDLAAKIVPGYNFAYGTSNPSDDNGHGTHVAGIAAAVTNNGSGVAGVSWGSKIMPVKVLDSFGSGDDFAIQQAIVWAADNGAKVINMSLGGPGYLQSTQDAVNYAYGKGVVLVAAAGNSGVSTPYYPAAYNHVISVSATGNSDIITSYSNYGSWIDVAAPGGGSVGTDGIISTFWDSGSHVYASGTGTSMAAPHVSGLAALLRAYSPTLTNDQVEQQIESMADDLGSPGKDNYYGYGRINALKALFSVHPNGALVKTASDTRVYLLEGGSKRWITSPASFESNGFRWDRIVTVSDGEVAGYPTGADLRSRPGTLIRASGDPAVYAVDLSGPSYIKRWITSATIFEALGYRWEDIYVISGSEIATYTDGGLVSDSNTHRNGTLIKSPTDPHVYLLEGASKRWIASPASFESNGFRWDRIVTVSDAEIAGYPTGANLQARPGILLKSATNPAVYVTDFSSGYIKRWVTSASIFEALGYHWEDIRVVSPEELAFYTNATDVR